MWTHPDEDKKNIKNGTKEIMKVMINVCQNCPGIWRAIGKDNMWQ